MFKLYSCLNLSEVKQDKRIFNALEDLKSRVNVDFDIYSQWTDNMILLKSFKHNYVIHIRVVLDGYACHLSLFKDEGKTEQNIKSITLRSDKWDQFKKEMGI